MRITRPWLKQQLATANPWWGNPDWEKADRQLLALAAAPFQRLPRLLDDIAPPNLYTLRGTRRVGKSTLLKQTVRRLISQGVDPRRICFFAADALGTPDHLVDLFQVARTYFPDLDAFGTPRYFLIDEVTAIAEWYRGMKWLRDNSPAQGDCIVVAGSSATDVAEGTGFLAGRRGTGIGLDRLMLPFSFPEFVEHAGYAIRPPVQLPYAAFFEEAGRTACQDALVHLDPLVDAFDHYLTIGGFPQAVADFRQHGAVSDAFCRDLWDVIRADLQRQGVTQVEVVLRLLERVARHLSSPFEYAGVADDLGVARATVMNWVEALANGYVVFRLLQQERGLPSPARQRKVYPVDPVVTLLPARLVSDAFGPELTQLAEAALAIALFRAVEGDRVDAFAQPERVFLFRRETGAEVDFLVLPDRPAESKYSDAVTRREAQSMLANFKRGLLLSRGHADVREPVPIIPSAIFAWLLAQQG